MKQYNDICNNNNTTFVHLIPALVAIMSKLANHRLLIKKIFVNFMTMFQFIKLIWLNSVNTSVASLLFLLRIPKPATDFKHNTRRKYTYTQYIFVTRTSSKLYCHIRHRVAYSVIGMIPPYNVISRCPVKSSEGCDCVEIIDTYVVTTCDIAWLD